MNIDLLRSVTPGCKNRIHFNNAGASLLAQPVLTTVIDYLKLEAEIGAYEAAEYENHRLEGFYTSVARLINCHQHEVAYFENATRAWDMALHSIDFKNGDRILVGQSEYTSNYIALLQLAKKYELDIAVVKNDSFGQVCVESLEKSLCEKVKLIAITHIPSNGGLVNPVEEIGVIAAREGIIYLLDTCQSLGQRQIDVELLQCTFLVGTGRKFLRGPRGTGFLYVRKTKLNQFEPTFLDLHAAKLLSPTQYEMRLDARRFESWECHCAGKLGLSTAIDYALALGIENIQHRVETLANLLRAKLGDLENVVIQDKGLIKSGIITFTITNKDSRELARKLRVKNINVSVSRAEFAGLDCSHFASGDYVRASLHYYNTEAEIETFMSALLEIN